jgi:hypothetical protein
MAWKIEEDPGWSVRTLRKIAKKPCVEFQERKASGKRHPFCGRCYPCVAGLAILLIYRERKDAISIER